MNQHTQLIPTDIVHIKTSNDNFKKKTFTKQKQQNKIKTPATDINNIST